MVLAAVLFVAAHAGALVGTVLDPQGLAVTGVAVELRCGDDVRTAISDGAGAFRFADTPEAPACTLAARVHGFEPFQEPIAAGTGELVVRLRLATIREGVKVAGEVAPAAVDPHAPINGFELLAGELERISTSTDGWIRYAALRAGSPGRSQAVYVDGMPASVLPPTAAIERIRVDSHPFSAEYADGDATAIHLVTRAPARRFRVTPSGSGLALGGHDAVRDGLDSHAAAGGVTLSGGLPRLPLGLAGTVNVSRRATEIAFDGSVPGGSLGPSSSPVWDDSHIRSLLVSGHYTPAPHSRVHVAYSTMAADGENVGVGGLVLPSAGFSSRSSTHGLHGTVRVTKSRLAYEGGVSLKAYGSHLQANSNARGVTVAGHFVDGGAGFTRTWSDRATLTSKHVLRGQSTRAWMLGAIVTGTAIDQEHVPNPHGTITFDSATAYVDGLTGRPTATWFLWTGRTDARFRGWTVAPFAQATLVRTPRFQLDAGLRVDRQSGVDTLVSPRIWASTLWRGVKLQGGSGVFAQPVADAVLLRAITDDGTHLRSAIATGVSIDDLADASGTPLVPLRDVRTALSRDFAMPRQWLHRAAVELPVPHVTTTLEYTHARGIRLLGADRTGAGADLLDAIAANRSSSTHRVHGRLEFSRGGQRLGAHYEWSHGRDDTAGAFSHPARAGRIAEEWARSAGLPAHVATFTGTLTLPAHVFLTITGSWQSGSPYDITTGLDPEDLGLFTDRGGRARNSGEGPAQQVASVHLSRRWTLPRIGGWPKTGRRVNVGLQIDNLFDAANPLAFGSVANAPTFGRALGPTPGRSARVSFSID